MKKTILLACILTASHIVMAQFNVAVEVKGALVSANVKNINQELEKKMRIMPGAGIAVQQGFSEGFALRSGLNWNRQASNVGSSTTHSNMRIKTEMDFLQLPLQALFYSAPGSVRFYAGPGGYAAYGLGGTVNVHMKNTASGSSMETTETFDAFVSEADGGAGLKRWDFGLTGQVGLEHKKMFLQAQYQFGIKSLVDGDKDNKYRNRGASISIGYYFK